jgi:hypothetical protein
MNDSLQQVHSWKWNQTTGIRGFLSRALMTWATELPAKPREAVIQVQARMKSRRETPLAWADSHTDGLFPSVMLPPTSRMKVS